MFLPIPNWDSIHPLLVHLPLGLLFIVPVLVLLGMFHTRAQSGFLLSAFVLMVVGTIGIWLAISSGEAAEELAERIPLAEATLERHEDLGELSRNLFSVLTPIYGLMILVQLTVKGLPKWIAPTLTVLFLLFYGGSLVVLANTGHEGARLVHEFGVHAMQKGPDFSSASTGRERPAFWTVNGGSSPFRACVTFST